MIKKKCLQCNKEFEVKDYRKDTAKFCSRECSSKYHYDERLRNIDKSYMIGNKYREGLKPKNAFEKGHIPFNKGTKGIMKPNRTSFKKGRINENKRNIGDITIREHRGKKRQWVKIGNPNIWELYAVYLWKEKYGDVPKGFIVHHKNSNMLDDRIENLEILTRSEHINIHREDLLKGKKNNGT